MWTIFETLLNLLEYYFCFMFSFLGPRSLWDLLPNQGSNPHPCMGRCSRNHWTAREVPSSLFDPQFPHL